MVQTRTAGAGAQTRTRAWRDGAAAERDFPLEQVSDLLAEDGVVVWVDFTDPTADDLRQVEDELGVHALAVEDAVEPGQRPKLDRYREGLFLVAYDVTCPHEELVTHEVKAFLTKDAIVTMHDGGFSFDQVEQRWDDAADLADHGVLWLTWGLLDLLSDHAVQTAEQLTDRVEALEDDLFGSSGQGQHIQRRSFALRKALGTLRRLTVPTKDAVSSLLRLDEMRSRWGAMLHEGGGAATAGGSGPGVGGAWPGPFGAGAGGAWPGPFGVGAFGMGAPSAPGASGMGPSGASGMGPSGVDGSGHSDDPGHGDGSGHADGPGLHGGLPGMNGMAPYYRDVVDHLTSVAESVEEGRDTLSNVLDTDLNLASNRQNLVMKKVTSWAAIIAIPTAITGFFGQNVTLPWGGSWAGLVLSSGTIAVTSVLLYAGFKRRDWL